MIKKNLLYGLTTSLLSLSVLMTSSCQTGTQTAATQSKAEASQTEAVLPIAYVQMDSLSANYQYAKDIQVALEKDAKDGRAKLQSKAGAFQKAAKDFERRLKINAFVSQDAAKAEQNRVLRLQQQAQALEVELTQKMGMKQQLMLEDMMKEVKAQLKTFNNGRYKLILTNVGNDNILFAEEGLDITDDFIKFLNDNYKAKGEKEAVPAKEVKKEDKKK